MKNHLVMAKQPTIIKKDPFKTERIEAKMGDIVEKHLRKYVKRVINDIKSEENQ